MYPPPPLSPLKAATKEFPKWCFLAPAAVSTNATTGVAGKAKDLMPISYDGKQVNTRLLRKKLDVMETERAFNRCVAECVLWV